MKRVSISTLMRETGLSRATIDRVLNGRGNVHARTRKAVEESMARLAALPAQSRLDRDTLRETDVVLRLGRGLMDQIHRAKDNLGAGPVRLHDIHQKDDAHILALIRELCRDIARPLIITAKNSEGLRTELVNAKARGKRIVTLVSDLAHDARAAFVGVDNRMAGQTAAFVLGNFFVNQEAKVGVVLGDYAFSCHEDREIGFRTCLRANFPNIQVADVAKSDDSSERTYEAVKKLLREHPAIKGIYNVAGGNAGLAEAIVESGLAVRVISHEANHITAPLVRNGLIHYLISQDPNELLKKALDIAAMDDDDITKEIYFIDFGVYTRFNLPDYGTAAREPDSASLSA